MKRNRDDRSYVEKVDESMNAGRIPAHASLSIKRAKSTQACLSCRRHKTRCEQMDNSSSSGSQRCHRCKVLNMHCSFDDSSGHTTKESPPTMTPIIFDEDTTPTHPPNMFGTKGMQPEDLVPASTTPWGFLKGGFDWTATPMLALQELARGPNPGDGMVSDHTDLSMVEIITPDQIRFLLETFATRYSPWLNLPPSRDDHAPLLDLVRCTVASRHLDAVTRSIVAPQLQRITDEAIFKRMFSPIPSTESLHALLILAMWTPVSGIPQPEARDSRLLVASAVSMAMNLRLGQASVYVTSLLERKAKENGLSTNDTLDLGEAMEKARLWICLTNVESMLCAGTGRSPLSQRAPSDNSVISSSLLTAEPGPELRLGLMSQLFDITERGFQIQFSSFSEVDKWYKEVLEVLGKMDRLHRILSPLPVVTDREIFYFHMLLVYYNFCRLLVIHRALREARRVLEDKPAGKPWYRQLIHQGINIGSVWGQDAVLTAEAVLVASLSRQENIGTAPDIVFAMISFAAVWLIMAKFAMFHNQGEQLPGVSNGLLVKVIERLSQSAITPDHTSAKCAQLIATSMRMLETRTVGLGHDEDKDMSGVSQVSAERAPHAQFAVPDLGRFPADKQHSLDILNAGTPHEFKSFMNSDVLMDTAFWSSFMNNLSTDPPNR